MLTFFRRIRKGLLGSGSTGKYIMYAVGEILLVMIGILLALQVNNWNNSRKDQALESYLLLSLKEDLLNDLEELNGNIQDALNIQLGSNGLIDFKNGIPKSTAELDTLVRYINGVSFDINNLTYNEMLSAGTFKLLSDELRRKTAKYYWTIDSYDGMRDDNLQLKRATVQQLYKNGCTPNAIVPEELRKAMNDNQFLAIVKQWKKFGPYQARAHKGFKSNAQDLLEMVENEIEVKNY